jgi:hypothetical protein
MEGVAKPEPEEALLILPFSRMDFETPAVGLDTGFVNGISFNP